MLANGITNNGMIDIEILLFIMDVKIAHIVLLRIIVLLGKLWNIELSVKIINHDLILPFLQT